MNYKEELLKAKILGWDTYWKQVKHPRECNSQETNVMVQLILDQYRPRRGLQDTLDFVFEDFGPAHQTTPTSGGTVIAEK